MKNKKALDEVEAKYGTAKVMHEDVREALRSFLHSAEVSADATLTDEYRQADLVIDRTDVHERTEARRNLFQKSLDFLKAGYVEEARTKLEDVKGQGLGCTSGGYCSRKARSKLVMPEGAYGRFGRDVKIATACFQHEEDMLASYAGAKVRAAYGEASLDGYAITLDEHHESQEPHDTRAYVDGKGYVPVGKSTPVTVAEIWDRVDERVRIAWQSIPPGAAKDAFEKLIAEFNEKYRAEEARVHA